MRSRRRGGRFFDSSLSTRVFGGWLFLLTLERCAAPIDATSSLLPLPPSPAPAPSHAGLALSAPFPPESHFTHGDGRALTAESESESAGTAPGEASAGTVLAAAGDEEANSTASPVPPAPLPPPGAPKPSAAPKEDAANALSSTQSEGAGLSRYLNGENSDVVLLIFGMAAACALTVGFCALRDAREGRERKRMHNEPGHWDGGDDMSGHGHLWRKGRSEVRPELGSRSNGGGTHRAPSPMRSFCLTMRSNLASEHSVLALWYGHPSESRRAELCQMLWSALLLGLVVQGAIWAPAVPSLPGAVELILHPSADVPARGGASGMAVTSPPAQSTEPESVLLLLELNLARVLLAALTAAAIMAPFLALFRLVFACASDRRSPLYRQLRQRFLCSSQAEADQRLLSTEPLRPGLLPTDASAGVPSTAQVLPADAAEPEGAAARAAMACSEALGRGNCDGGVGGGGGDGGSDGGDHGDGGDGGDYGDGLHGGSGDAYDLRYLPAGEGTAPRLEKRTERLARLASLPPRSPDAPLASAAFRPPLPLCPGDSPAAVSAGSPPQPLPPGGSCAPGSSSSGGGGGLPRRTCEGITSPAPLHPPALAVQNRQHQRAGGEGVGARPLGWEDEREEEDGRARGCAAKLPRAAAGAMAARGDSPTSAVRTPPRSRAHSPAVGVVSPSRATSPHRPSRNPQRMRLSPLEGAAAPPLPPAVAAVPSMRVRRSLDLHAGAHSHAPALAGGGSPPRGSPASSSSRSSGYAAALRAHSKALGAHSLQFDGGESGGRDGGGGARSRGAAGGGRRRAGGGLEGGLLDGGGYPAHPAIAAGGYHPAVSERVLKSMCPLVCAPSPPSSRTTASSSSYSSYASSPQARCTSPASVASAQPELPHAGGVRERAQRPGARGCMGGLDAPYACSRRQGAAQPPRAEAPLPRARSPTASLPPLAAPSPSPPPSPPRPRQEHQYAEVRRTESQSHGSILGRGSKGQSGGSEGRPARRAHFAADVVAHGSPPRQPSPQALQEQPQRAWAAASAPAEPPFAKAAEPQPRAAHQPQQPPPLPGALGLDLSSVPHDLTDATIDRLRAAFHRHDSDASATIERRALGSLARALGLRMRRDELARAFASAETDGNGRLGFEEFVVWYDTLAKVSARHGGCRGTHTNDDHTARRASAHAALPSAYSAAPCTLRAHTRPPTLRVGGRPSRGSQAARLARAHQQGGAQSHAFAEMAAARRLAAHVGHLCGARHAWNRLRAAARPRADTFGPPLVGSH